MTNIKEINEIINKPKSFWINSNKEILQKYLNKIENLLPIDDTEIYTNITVIQMELYNLLHNTNKALQIGLKALKNIGKKKTENLYKIYDLIGKIYVIIHDNKKALNYFKKAENLALKNNFLKEYLKIKINQANIFLIEKNFEKAKEIYDEILKESKKHKYLDLVADIYTNFGLIYLDKEDYKKSLSYYQKAIKLYEKTSKRKNLYLAYANLSKLYHLLNHYDKAIEYAKRAVNLGEKFKEWFKLSQLYNNLGSFYLIKKDFEKSKEYLLKSLNIKREIGDKSGISKTLNNISQLFFEQKDYNEAIKYLDESINIKKELNDTEGILTSLYNLSNIYLETKEYENALKTIRQMQKIAEKEKINSLSNIYELLYKYYEKKHNYKLALNYLKKYSESYFKEITKIQDKKIHELLSKFENEKAEKEKKLQYLKNIELKRANATKDKFFSIIAHDLKSPFSSITFFISLMKEGYEKFSMEKINKLINELDESVKNTYSLLENLLTWSRLQTKSMKFNPKELIFYNIVAKVLSVYYYKAKTKNISLEQDIPKNIKIFADEFMIYTVIRNLVNNSIKFTHSGGKIKISAEQEEDFVHIIVSDTGVGIPKNKIPKLFKIESSFSTYGTNQEKGTGLGLILCKNFIDKNNGKIKVESKVGSGTKFHIYLPNLED